MELLFLFFFMSVPVFYIYGIVQLLSKKKQRAKIREQIITELLNHSQIATDQQEKHSFEKVAQYLGTHSIHSFIPLTEQPTLPTNHPSQVHDQIQTEKQFQASASHTSPFHSIDNINILLYLGAFLVIVASGIFANYSYASLSGLTKTIFMLLFAGSFYLAGLLMYQRSEKIRPAALVFTTIGLLAFPLVGVVAYNFWLPATAWRVLWFIVSIGCVSSYFWAWKIIRHTLLEYLTVFTALSLFQSTMSLFNVAVYYYYWGFTLFALLSVAFQKLTHRFTPQTPIYRISQLLLPVSILLSTIEAVNGALLQVAVPEVKTLLNESFFQASVTMGLATIFYAVHAYLAQKEHHRTVFAGLAGITFPTGVLFMWRQFEPSLLTITISATMVAIAAAYTQLSEVCAWKKWESGQKVFAHYSGLLILLALYLGYQFHLWSLLLAILGLALVPFLFSKIKEQTLFVVFGIILFSLPYTLTQLFPLFKPDYFQSLLYLGTVFGFFAIRKITLATKEGRQMHLLGYSISIILAWAIASFSNEPTTILSLLTISITTLVLIFVERLDTAIALPFASIYFIIWRYSTFHHLSAELTAMLLATFGVIVYGSSLLNFVKQRKQLVMVGVAGPVLSMISTVDLIKNSGIFSASGLLAGGLLIAEYIHTKKRTVLHWGVAVILASIQVYLYNIVKITELQLYTLSWSGYVLWLSLKAQNSQKDQYYMLALAIGTIPMGIEALTDQLKGLVLILEGLFLVVAGMQLQKKVIQHWGSGVLILEVLYYTRGFILNLPAWALFGGIGMAILGGSVYLLHNRKSE